MQGPELTADDFERIRALLYRSAGIALGESKQPLVAGRLHRRLGAVGVESYREYIDRIESASEAVERQVAIDLLTTNETYFWREPQHFSLMLEYAAAAARARQSFSVWSAASSSGEEAYTLAMLLDRLADTERGLRWELMGSDISQRVLERARRGQYPLERASRLPPELLHRYCLRGQGEHEGTLLVARELRQRVTFRQINLIQTLPEVGPFAVVFLRNVLIYFDPETKIRVLRAVAARLAEGGRLFVGLSESLHGLNCGLQQVAPGVYTRAATP
ncbi:MAG: SAM-dependent methyltransferase [Gammaproteobacteria bacterium]|nr:MAG: SAM-dependent methyltransferase [Gammaproteobacteria bacterium]